VNVGGLRQRRSLCDIERKALAACDRFRNGIDHATRTHQALFHFIVRRFEKMKSAVKVIDITIGVDLMVALRDE
jgi:hypothetical protein